MSTKTAIFVINLEYRSDRRIAIEKELLRVGWQAEFFPAIRPNSAANFPSIGARGCYLSHLSVLRSARHKKIERLIILEDDLNFAPDFAEDWDFSMFELERKEWSIFYPGHTLENLQPGLTRLAPQTSVQCSHFIVINGSAFSPIIDELERILSRPAGHPIGGPMHVDGAYSAIRMHDPSLITYAYSPALGYQRPSRTDIGKLKWFDRIKSLRGVIGFARKVNSAWRALR
jgi:glycosyl transferase, family 25